MSGIPPTDPTTSTGGPDVDGHGVTPPGAGTAPPTGSGDGPRFTRNHLMAIGAVIMLLLGAIGGLLIVRAGDASADEVFLEPVGSEGENPFTASVVDDADDEVQEAIDDDARATASGAGVQSYSGGQPGLYGGTQNSRHCDKQQLVDFLDANPTKADAWSSVHGITRRQIASFVGDLTPVLLREDTRVTNHGFVDSTANAIPAVLQAGTAVLVDRFGRPVVKCACGNPLLAPRPASSPRYTGTRWTGFSPTSITVIQQSTTEIDVFVLTDPLTGDRFRRPAGTDGDEDTPDEDEEPPPPTTTTTTTVPPTTLPPEPPPTSPPQQSFGARGELERRLAQCAGVTFPFEEHVSETIGVERTGVSSLERVTLTGTTASGNQQVFSWLYDSFEESLTPDSPLASEAAQYCSALSG